MRIKTSELDGLALRWAVAYCEGFAPFSDGISWIIADRGTYKQLPDYCTDWATSGPIIEREEISICPNGGGRWWSHCPRRVRHQYGNTPLAAALRCYVASKLGDEAEIPDELA